MRCSKGLRLDSNRDAAVACAVTILLPRPLQNVQQLLNVLVSPLATLYAPLCVLMFASCEEPTPNDGDRLQSHIAYESDLKPHMKESQI